MKYKPVIIQKVLSGSIAEEAGIEQGDVLVSINGEHIKDVFDYRFLAADEELLVEVRKKDGELWELEIEKDEYEDLGIEFENSMIDEAKGCTNECIFCFIDQLPKNLRKTLYFKDDDSRLSFLTGNYVTLTNMKEQDIDRIIKYRMSPINISVHTTHPELRIRMLNNRFAGKILEHIKKLVSNGITVNCQIVLCRDINDGDELDRTVEDLAALYPGVYSISVVPVGITRHRSGLPTLRPFDRESSAHTIHQISAWQEKLLKTKGSRVVYLADEFYIMAEHKLPDYECYEDFPQIENGVGLIPLFIQEFNEYLQETSLSLKRIRNVSIATGVSSYKFIKELAEILEKKFDELKIIVYAIKNDFFGENVTVTGLLTGQDILSQLAGKELGEELLLSRSVLKAEEELFLDDYTVEQLSRELNIKVRIVENNGSDFINKIVMKNDE